MCGSATYLHWCTSESRTCGLREANSGDSSAIGEIRSKLQATVRFHVASTAICAIYSNSTGMYAGQEGLGRELPWCVILSANAL